MLVATLSTVRRNRPPRVAIRSPVHGATFAGPAHITIDVDASDPDGTIRKVELFDRSRAIVRSQATAPPWRFSFPVEGPFSGALTAHAYDDHGREAMSSVVKYQVRRAPPGPPLAKVATLEADFPSAGLPGMGFEAVPSIVEVSGGELLVAFYAGHYELSSDSAIYLTRRPRGGAWTRPLRIIDEPGVPEGNPVLADDGHGTLYCFYVVIPGDTWEEARLRYRTSKDRGRTWTAAVSLDGPAHAPSDGTMSACKPLPLPGGDFLLPLNGESYDADPRRQWYSFFRRFTHGGAGGAARLTFVDTEPLFTSPGNIQPSIVDLGRDRLLAFLRPRGLRGKIWRTLSEDAGRTWAAPVATELDTPSSRNDVVRLPSGAIVIAFNDSPTLRTPLSLALSRDEGVTFPIRRVIESGDFVYGYNAMVAATDGRIHLVYNHNLDAIRHVAVDEAWFTAEANLAPELHFDGAVGDRVVRPGETLHVTVHATDADGIERVELLDSDRIAGVAHAAPFDFTLRLAAGPHALRARAVDRRGGLADTAQVFVTAASPRTPACGEPKK
jgi:predicted neuraminidase